MRRSTLAGTVAVTALGISALTVRSWYLRWGATDEEAGAVLPGDALVPVPDLVSNRAITIGAAPRDVWPWLVQIGQQRGGFYSYDALENLVGCDIHTSDRIVEEWQNLAVADEINLAPQMALTVAVVELDRALVLTGGVPVGGAPAPFDFSWAFVLRDGPGGSTRLVVRERYSYRQRWAPILVEPVQAVSFVMSQKMLRGIRDRAERTQR